MKEKFINEITAAIDKRFGKGYSVQFQKIVKDRDVVVPAAVICKCGATTSIAVHIGELLEDLEHGETSMGDAAQKVIMACEEVQRISSYVDVIKTPNKWEILRRVTYHLVNTEKNVGKLRGCPHKDLLDLSAVYKVTVKDNGIETASIIVDHGICERAGISEAELDEAADSNTDSKWFLTRPFNTVFPGVLDGTGIDPGCLWVYASKIKDDGVAVMFYPRYFRKLARKLGRDLYVALSGRHEVIVTPVKDGIAPDGLKKIASKINSNRAIPGETISENIYRYKYRKGRFEIINL